MVPWAVGPVFQDPVVGARQMPGRGTIHGPNSKSQLLPHVRMCAVCHDSQVEGLAAARPLRLNHLDLSGCIDLTDWGERHCGLSHEPSTCRYTETAD